MLVDTATLCYYTDFTYQPYHSLYSMYSLLVQLLYSSSWFNRGFIEAGHAYIIRDSSWREVASEIPLKTGMGTVHIPP